MEKKRVRYRVRYHDYVDVDDDNDDNDDVDDGDDDESCLTYSSRPANADRYSSTAQHERKFF